MSRPTIRQQSLEQPFIKKTPQLQALMRKQKSADDKRSFHTNTPSHFDKSSKSKKGNSWGSERSKVRIAWNSQDDANVEVVASKIGTVTNKKTNLLSSLGSSSILESDKATILYSRQELAERLRLAWKQREANKSNIDIFLAHGTIDDESRCESRLSLNNNHQNHEKDVSLSSFVFSSSSSSSSSPTYSSSKSQEDLGKEIKKPLTDARSKRASFQSGTNLAFTGLNNSNKIVIPSVIKSNDKRLEKQPDKSTYKPITTPIIDVNKTKRTNSAPPLQRPVSSVTLGCLPSASSRTKVNIIIDTPKIVANKDEKIEKKNLNSTENGDSKNVNSFTQNTFIPLSNNSSTTSIDKSRAFVFKKRTRSGKRRVEEVEKKNECKSNLDVVTMVSLISDADSDSEIEKNSPRDNKLIRQLRNNFPTASIIKQCSTMTTTTNVGIVHKSSEDSLISRRVFKTVSFQQDSIEKEDNVRKIENDKRSANYNEGLSKMIMQHQSQLQQVIQDAVHKDNHNTWQYDMGSKNSPSSTYSNYWKTNEESSPVLDKEKRCLIVPIDDRIDKKRKLLLQRTKSVPSDVTYMEQPLTMQIEEKDCPISLQRQIDVGSFIHQTEASPISLQTSLSKMIQKKKSEEMNPTSMEALNVDIQPQEPYLRTTKEKECWHLYKKMCDKGVCVSFDTVLRSFEWGCLLQQSTDYGDGNLLSKRRKVKLYKLDKKKSIGVGSIKTELRRQSDKLNLQDQNIMIVNVITALNLSNDSLCKH